MHPSVRRNLLAAAAWYFCCAAALPAADPPPDPDADDMNLNVKTRTLGGVQFWGDMQYFHGWHIQRNVYTGHYRLLDEHDVRHAWGTLEHCRERLAEIRDKEQLPAMSGEVVIVLHGIGRSNKSMVRLAAHLRAKGFFVVNMNYPSTRVSLEDSAGYVRQVVESLEGIDSISVVAFSMGGLVARAWLGENGGDPRLKRIVFIGSPHLGADLASLFEENWAYKQLLGPAGQQLFIPAEGAALPLPVPEVEFGVIAGERGNDTGYNPLIPGDDDGMVSVDSTRLPGAADFACVRTIHTLLNKAPDTLEFTVRFLKEGRFRAEGERQPIPREAEEEGEEGG